MDQKSISRIDRKKEETLNKIVAAAVELFNRFGLDGVTMEQIADTADIAKGTLYNYFPSKEAIINAYIQRAFQTQNDDREQRLKELPDTHARLVYIFTLLIEGVQRQKQIFETFFVYRMKQVISFEPVAENERTGLSKLVQTIVTLGQQSRELRADLPEDYLSGLFEYTLIAAIKPLYLNPVGFDPHTAVEQSADLFLNGARRR